jgi:hypothetical protein
MRGFWPDDFPSLFPDFDLFGRFFKICISKHPVQRAAIFGLEPVSFYVARKFEPQ